MFKRTEALTKIADTLGAIKSSCEHRGLLHLFDNHTVAQHFFCRLLNAAYDLDLVELDNLEENFPAIDLGDKKQRIAYQVTTQKVSEKVTKTLETFDAHHLGEQFDKVKILVIGDRQNTYGAVVIPDGLKFSTEDDIIDVAGLLKYIRTLDTPHLEAIQKILAEEVISPVKLSASATGLSGLAIDIGVVREPPAHIDPSDTFTNDRVLRYVLTKEKGEEETTVISPQMDYLSQMGKSPLEAISFFWNPFKCHYPSLDVTFVNNTGETIVVTDAVFEVAESVPDLTPVILFKDDNARMRLVIDNEGWGKVCNPVIRCNILSTGATEVLPDPPIAHIPVAEPYAHEFQLPDFEETATLELEDTFARLGVNLEAIRQAGYKGQTPMALHAMQNGLDVNLWQHYGRFPALDTNEAWAPFPDGYAVVAGRLDYKDERGAAYSIPFKVRVFLFQIKYQLPIPPSYTYNVMLEPEGKKYEVACSTVHSLQKGEADRIHIRVGCLRSATHKFRIKWRLSGGRELVSAPITLQHFIPRRWAGRQRKRAEVGQAEEVQLPPPNAQSGCVEESIRNAMQLAAAVAQARQRSVQMVGYFAYGPNMYLPRVQKWAKSARHVMSLGIPGFAMKFNKVGEDGTAKCNIVHTGKDEDTVAGVVFEMTAADMEKLNESEKGYDLVELRLNLPSGPVRLLLHVATDGNTAEGLQPFSWYKNYVLEGAKMFQLPQSYIDSVILPVEAKEAPAPTDFE
jgi:hypothetical protein